MIYLLAILGSLFFTILLIYFDKTEYREHDIVITTENIGDLPKGSVCTIIHIYNDNNYVIETRGYAELNVKSSQIKKL